MSSKRTSQPRVAPPKGWALLLETWVAGVRYYEFGDGRLPLDEGMTVELIREPGNEYDHRAIAVHTPKGAKLGYLPRRKNKLPSRLMDAGWTLTGRIERIETPHSDIGRRGEKTRRPTIRISVFAPRFQ